jgi:ABC-2 type transport system ATP-binding protein
MSSHILAEVEATCDRILIINKGKIVADGTADDLRKRSQGNEIIQVTIEDGSRNEIYEALKNIETVQLIDFIDHKENSFEIQSRPELSSRRNVFNLCLEKNWVLTEMKVTEAKLEDVFRELTL